MRRDARSAGAAPKLNFLPRPLLEPRRPAVAIFVGALAALIPSLLLSFLVQYLAPAADQPAFPFSGAQLVFALVVFAPVVETLIMGTVLLLLLRFVGPTTAVVLSALGWAIAHSTQAAIWGLVIWWPFLIFSTLFVTWQSRSLLAAFAIPTAVHALQNLGPALLIATGKTA